MNRLVQARLLILVIVPCLALAGCGSSGSASTDSDAVMRMASALSAYNSVQPHTLKETGRACATALASLQGASILATPVASGTEKKVRTAVHRAYAWTRRGLFDCAASARTSDFALMVHADDEIRTANLLLDNAKHGG